MWKDTDVVVRQSGGSDRRPRSGPAIAWAATALILGLSGCGAVKQDVHRYYRQMALNYREAEEKARFDAAALEVESANSLRAGNVHKYNRTRKELTRIKDWEARCASQRERFAKAARTLESGIPGDPDAATPEVKAEAGSALTPPAG